MNRNERIAVVMNENINKYGAGSVQASAGYCQAFVDGMIAVEEIQKKYDNSERWFQDSLQKRDIISELISENSKMRMALLLIAEHKNPYKSFGFDMGSNGVRDHFIKIAKEAL